MPYQSILDRLLRTTGGATGALLLDSTGEVVAEAGVKDERRLLIGVYQGIMLAAARRVLRPVRAEDIQYLVTRYETDTLIVRPLRDGYYVVVILGSGANVPLGLRRSAAAQDRMNEAI